MKKFPKLDDFVFSVAKKRFVVISARVTEEERAFLTANKINKSKLFRYAIDSLMERKHKKKGEKK